MTVATRCSRLTVGLRTDGVRGGRAGRAVLRLRSADATGCMASRRCRGVALRSRHDQPQPGGRRGGARRGRRGRRRGRHRAARRAARRGRARCAQAGDRARGGTAVVTLEPCEHTGRTGPCTDGADRRPASPGSSSPCADPNPGAGGRRAAAARGRGRRRWPACRPTRSRAARSGLAAPRTPPAGRSSPGSSPPPSTAGSPPPTAPAAGSPASAARADVHRLRAEVDAVVVGVGTVLADDPQLTVRGADGRTRPRQPLRVVAGPPAAGVPADAPGSSTTPAETLVARRRPTPTALLDGAAGPRRPSACCSRAARRWPAPSWRAGLVDQVVGYLAPKLLGAGPPALRRRGNRDDAAALRSDAGRSPRSGRRRVGSADAGALRPTSAARGGAECSPASSRSSARSSPATTCGDAARLTRPRPRRSRRTPRHGDSIAVNGVCLTVVEQTDGRHVHRRRDGARRCSAARSARCGAGEPGQPRARRHASATGSAATSCRATSTASARVLDVATPASTGRSCGSRCPAASPATSSRRARSPSTASR